MKAMILAAGFGTRLLPLTRRLPKPLFPVMNRPLVSHTLDWLKAAGIDDVTLNLHHLPEQIVAALGGENQTGIHFSREEDILGTAGGIKQAERFLGGGPFIVANSDVLADVDLRAVMAFHREKGAALTLVVRRDARYHDAIDIDDEGRIVHFLGARARGHAGPATRMMFTGIQVMEPGIFDRIPGGRFQATTSDIFPAMVEEGLPVYAYTHKGYWLDLGTPETYLQAHKDALEGSLALRGHGRPLTGEGLSPPVWAGDGLSSAGAALGPCAVFGEGCRVAAGAVVENTVCWDEVTVGEGARVKNAILGRGAVVPAGARVVGEIVEGS